jgi:hypothetical protein
VKSFAPTQGQLTSQKQAASLRPSKFGIPSTHKHANKTSHPKVRHSKTQEARPMYVERKSEKTVPKASARKSKIKAQKDIPARKRCYDTYDIL